jgi:hypothetical protein
MTLRHSITKRADADIWQLDPKINALGPIVNKYLALLHSNQVVRDRACAELDHLFESNPKVFFEQGFDQVEDRFFSANTKRPRFSNWAHKAAESLAKKDPMTYLKWGLYFDERFYDILGTLYISIRIRIAPTGKELKEKVPNLFPQILEVVDLLSQKNPGFFIRHLADDPEYAKFFPNVGVKAEAIYTLTKIANQLDQDHKFDAANRVDAIIQKIGEGNGT